MVGGGGEPVRGRFAGEVTVISLQGPPIGRRAAHKNSIQSFQFVLLSLTIGWIYYLTNNVS